MTRIARCLPLLLVILSMTTPQPSYAEQAGATTHRVAAASLVAGDAFACVVTTQGAVRCWGSNSAGQLGAATNFGSSNPNPTPLPAVPLGARATAVAAGYDHACALLTTGRIRCWGDDSLDQLGTPTPAPIPVTSTPQPPVPLGGRAIAVTAGYAHTCALLGTGKVRCWGENGAAQLGVPAGDPTPVPQPTVPLGARATAISAGYSSTCAVLVTGAVRCWGDNSYGQLGSVTNASTETPNPHPLPAVPLGARATAVSVGRDFVCALLATGRVRCWGKNDGGQLGSQLNAGLTAANPYPLPALHLGAAATAVTAGSEHACARLVTGAVRCWGYNFFGQDGSTTNKGAATPTPAPQPALTFTEGTRSPSAVAVDAGAYFGCALTTTGHVHCWGANSPYGQLGTDQSTSDSAAPFEVSLDGVRVRATTALTARARPTTDRRAPYAFGISGRVTGAYAADAATCTGKVRLRLKRGTHTLASRTATLSPTCTWHATLTAPTSGLAHGSNRLTVTATLRATTNLAAGRRSVRVTAVR